ncbi:hypothetical protein [Cytobacillus oceanisediminis]|uniref:hypothetical protein n=1 Tax=Cytobacillus oceanisediminis TaxID=665099 RepID=UPI00203BC38E|nr:hypothetical protein [Cytobacillus oceanisediminis]MCM3404891.1 hypothetical protein [Cytobacillus oceanisediminis]
MNKLLIMLLLFASVLFLPLQTKAEYQVPTLKESEHWKVELLAPSKDKKFAQGEKGKYEVYSLLVTNKNEKAQNVSVRGFRNEPGTSKMYGLAPQMESDLIKKGQTFSFKNFPVKAGTEKLEFIIMWEEEPYTYKDGTKASSGRAYKESFVFNPKK